MVTRGLQAESTGLTTLHLSGSRLATLPNPAAVLAGVSTLTLRKCTAATAEVIAAIRAAPALTYLDITKSPELAELVGDFQDRPGVTFIPPTVHWIQNARCDLFPLPFPVGHMVAMCRK